MILIALQISHSNIFYIDSSSMSATHPSMRKKEKNALVYTLMQSSSLHLCYLLWFVPFNHVRKYENEQLFNINRDHFNTPALVIMTVYTEFSVSHQGWIFVHLERQQNKYRHPHIDLPFFVTRLCNSHVSLMRLPGSTWRMPGINSRMPVHGGTPFFFKEYDTPFWTKNVDFCFDFKVSPCT